MSKSGPGTRPLPQARRCPWQLEGGSMASPVGSTRSLGSYLPSTPVKVPKPIVEYSTHLVSAPVIALGGITADGRHLVPRRFEVTKRNRERVVAGVTNRWRIPQSLLSDLLGTSQAKRAVIPERIPSNISLVRIYTAEGPHGSINADRGFRDSTPLPATRMTSAATGQMDDRPLYHSRVSRSAPLLRHLPTPSVTSTQPSTAAHTTGRLTAANSPVKKFVPRNARPATPADLFYYHSKQNPTHSGAPDVLLKCLGTDWELHSPVIKKSNLLADHLTQSVDKSQLIDYYKSSMNAKLDNFVQGNKIFSNESSLEQAAAGKGQGLSAGSALAEEIARSQMDRKEDRGVRRDKTHPAHISTSKKGNVTVITLKVTGTFVTPDGLAVALGNLYHERLQVERFEAGPVMSAARLLEFSALEEHCADVMIRDICAEHLHTYYHVSKKLDKTRVVDVCERWLELHLVPDLSMRIQLRNVPLDLLQRVARSSRLFTFNEYSLFKVVCHWLFLQLNPQMQLLPSHTTVLAYFNSLPKQSALLEREEGQAFVNIFEALRLHGVIDTAQFQDIRSMNILPNSRVVAVLAEHYQSLQAGGDMGLPRTFPSHAIRHGFILDSDLPYHSEILSLHGFHFELKAVKEGTTYVFFMTRLKPTDPVLSFRQCERHTFSMRPDRDVKYSITVQSMSKGEQTLRSTGHLTQRFTLNGRNARSQSLTVEGMNLPLYTTFSVVFPQS